MNVICPHGIVPCTECRVKFNRYHNIDNNLIVDRLVELENHKTKQIDENRAVSKSLDEIRDDIDKLMSGKSNAFVCTDTYVNFIRRLEKLENYMNIKIEDKTTIQDIFFRISNIERDLDNLKKTVNYNAEITNERLNVNKDEIPYICPVCRGSGRYKLATAKCDSDIRDCHACKGTGIVWG